MVTQVTGLSKNGVSDWYIQRASSVVMGVYLVLLLGLILLAEELTFAVWSDLFSQTWMQVATLLTLIATCAHAGSGCGPSEPIICRVEPWAPRETVSVRSTSRSVFWLCWPMSFGA